MPRRSTDRSKLKCLGSIGEFFAPGGAASDERSVGPVIGVILLIVIVILLASTLTAMVLSMEDRLEEPTFEPATQNPWADDPLLGPETPFAGEQDVRYRVYFELEGLEGGEPMNFMTIEVDIDVGEGEDVLFAGTEKADLETFEIVHANGSVLDMTPAEGWEEGGNNLTVYPDEGAYHLQADDEYIEIIFGGVDNPAEAGTYDVTIASHGEIPDQEGELEIIER